MAAPLNQISGMPQINPAFSGWQTPITLIKITQVTDSNGIVTNNQTSMTFQGVIQPLSPQQVMLKPEGQRAWTWLQIHCFSGPQNLTTNDLVTYNGIEYKIMGVLDYSLDNYIEYNLIKNYQDDGDE